MEEYGLEVRLLDLDAANGGAGFGRLGENIRQNVSRLVYDEIDASISDGRLTNGADVCGRSRSGVKVTDGRQLDTIVLANETDQLLTGALGLSPNPPKDTDGRREESGRGVRELQGK